MLNPLSHPGVPAVLILKVRKLALLGKTNEIMFTVKTRSGCAWHPQVARRKW